MTPETAAPARPQRASLSGEMADLLIELSSAFSKHAMYPPGHPALAPAATAVITKLSDILRERGTLSLGVARDQLVIEGVATDSTHPLLHSLAERLHKHELGAISFAEGVTPEEISDILALISGEPERTGRPLGREPEEVLKGRPHVRLHPVRYDSLRIREGEHEPDKRRREGTYLWVGLAQAALAVEAVDPSAEPAEDEEEAGYDPDRVARAIDERRGDEAYDQVIIGYMVQIARDLRGADARQADELRDRFSALIRKLRPETLRRLLRMGGSAHQRREFLLDAAEGVAVDAVLELVQAATDEKESDISRWMMRLLSKMARHASVSEAPSKRQADEALREQVRTLLSGWQLENPNPTEYEQALSRMSIGTPMTRLGRGGTADVEPERIVQTSIEAGTGGPVLTRAVEQLIEHRRVAGLIELLDAASAGGKDGPEDETEDGPGDQGKNEAAEAIWQRLVEPSVVRRLVEEESPDFDALGRILPKAGVGAADALLDRLATARGLSTRRSTFDHLVSLGPAVGAPAAERIAQPERLPWFVLRNMLALLNALPGLPPGFDPCPLSGHESEQVRFEALKLCMRRPDARDEAVVRALADADTRIVALGAVEAARECPPEAEPHLRRLAANDQESHELRIHAVRALARLETEGARETLLEIVAPRRRRLGRERPQADPAIREALSELAARWPDDLRVKEALARAGDAPGGLPGGAR